ncbi:Centrosomal protein of 76 kDa, partial [Frankliniella fusca]
PDDLMSLLNDVQQFTSRDLKPNKKYKLLDIKITEENGFNVPYKKAVRRLEDSKRKPKGT